MIRSRLYLQIYVTLLVSLALVALTLSLLAMMGRFDSKGPFEDRVERFAAGTGTRLAAGDDSGCRAER